MQTRAKDCKGISSTAGKYLIYINGTAARGKGNEQKYNYLINLTIYFKKIYTYI